MKKIYSYMFAAVAIFAAASCQKEQDVDITPTPEQKGDAFAITAIANEDTKTVLVDNVKTYWTSSDALTVFDANGVNQKFTTEITENSASALFTTQEFALPEDMSTAMLLAVYPYTAGATTDFTTSVAGLEIPAIQQANAGGFDPDATIAFALGSAADQHSLKFNNVYGLFKFTIKNDGVKEVTIETNGGEKIAGEVVLGLDGTLVGTENAVSKVTLEGDFVNGSTYYVALIPGTYANGITVSFDNIKVKTTSKSITLAKNQVRSLGDLSNMIYLIPNSNWRVDNARFAAYFYGNGDKWVSMTDNDANGVFECAVPGGGYTNIIFCRMNPSAAANNWDNRWNQTGDLSFDNNCYSIDATSWDKGAWSDYVYSEKSSGTPNKLYLIPNTNWSQANARFAAYFFGNGEKWVSMSKVSGGSAYYCDVPSGYPNVIFCRMNPSATANNWDNKWTQTSDLTVPKDGNDEYIVASGAWDKGAGLWTLFQN